MHSQLVHNAALTSCLFAYRQWSLQRQCLLDAGMKSQGSHYLLILKFKDFSKTFKDPQISFSRTNSRRKFTALVVEQQYLMFIYVTMVQ